MKKKNPSFDEIFEGRRKKKNPELDEIFAAQVRSDCAPCSEFFPPKHYRKKAKKK